ncbi:MAG: hypothetical protein ABXS91_08615 [Sulfurimonas sp.]
MFNDVSREDVLSFFLNLVESDPRIAQHKDDLGIIALGNELGYKIDDAVNRNTNKISEFYMPTTEPVLLSKLMYELGYIRFQKPLMISAEVKSGVDVTLEKYQRFTSGVDIFILNEGITLQAGVAKKLTMTMGTRREFSVLVNNDNHFFKIPLKTTYRKLYDFKAYSGDTELKYSQQFVEEDSDVSIEVDIDGNMVLVVRTGNINGQDVKLNDVLRIEVFETVPSDDVPGSLGIIGDFDIICENIQKTSLYEPYLSIPQMQNILLHNKNINNSLVYNEDFKNFIKANVRGIDLIKVWQQEQEDAENGELACNINKVFVSFLSDGVRGVPDINNDIQNTVHGTAYGRFVEFYDPLYVPITLQVDIVNNTKRSIQSIKIDEIKNELIGYYDDIDRIINKVTIYKTVISALSDHDIDVVDITMTNKPEAQNATFYSVVAENLTINVTER